jgi:hypothetical protein
MQGSTRARRPMRILRTGLGKTPPRLRARAKLAATLHWRSCAVAESTRTMRSLYARRPSMAASAGPVRSGLEPPLDGTQAPAAGSLPSPISLAQRGDVVVARRLAPLARAPRPAQKSTPPRGGGRPRSPAYGGIDRSTPRTAAAEGIAAPVVRQLVASRHCRPAAAARRNNCLVAPVTVGSGRVSIAAGSGVCLVGRARGVQGPGPGAPAGPSETFRKGANASLLCRWSLPLFDLSPGFKQNFQGFGDCIVHGN